MKKLTSIATALCMATTFCGFCVGCANEIEANNKIGQPKPEITASADESGYKVILCPGYTSGYGSTANTIDSGAVKLDAAGEEKYWVSNGYSVEFTPDAALPTPTTAKDKTTFVGWQHAVDGTVETVTKMPKTIQDDLILYARWFTEGQGVMTDGGTIVTPTPTGVTVNGHKMIKNDKASNEEYMILGVEFATGATLAFTVDGSAIALSSFDAASTGLSYSGGTVTVAKGGSFDLYLKKLSSGWELYGSRAIQADEVSIKGETAVSGNVYLAGNITGADFSWNDWNDATGKHKAAKATKSGSTYTLTVKLTQGDNCKFVKYSTSGSSWQQNLSGGGVHISYGGGAMDNMIVKTTGTYTFTVTEISSGLSVSVTYSA